MDLDKIDESDADEDENDGVNKDEFGHLQKQIEEAIKDVESRQRLDDEKRAEEIRAQ